MTHVQVLSQHGQHVHRPHVLSEHRLLPIHAPIHVDHVQEVPARGRREATHQRAVLHERGPGGGSGQQLVVVKRVDAEESKVGAHADVGEREGGEQLHAELVGHGAPDGATEGRQIHPPPRQDGGLAPDDDQAQSAQQRPHHLAGVGVEHAAVVPQQAAPGLACVRAL